MTPIQIGTRDSNHTWVARDASDGTGTTYSSPNFSTSPAQATVRRASHRRMRRCSEDQGASSSIPSGAGGRGAKQNHHSHFPIFEIMNPSPLRQIQFADLTNARTCADRE